ncbi:MAG: DUF5304 family protein [Actinomycetes bacterium]
MTSPHAEGVGSVAEEASRLFAAFESWVKDTAGGATAAVDAHIATGAAECQLCPVCRMISLVRGTRPEVFEHLVDATASMLAALRAAVDAHEKSWASRRESPVQHIDIG